MPIAALALAPALVLGGVAVAGTVKHRRTEAAEARQVPPPACSVHGGTRFSAWHGPCRAARTPQGRVVALAETPDRSLLSVRDGTLIVAGSWEPQEADLLAYADALRPVDAGDVD